MTVSFRWIMPFLFVAGGIIIGIFFEKLVLKHLKRIAARTKWKGDEIIVSALRGMLLLWFILAGLFGAISVIPMKKELISLFEKFLFIAFAVALMIAAAKALAGFVGLSFKRTKGKQPSTIFTNLAQLLVFLLGGLIILQSLGISITPLLTALGVGGIAVALALQDTLTNLFSGLYLIASRQIETGDYIRLENGDEGYVADVTWRNTTLRALSNNMIVVPNSRLASSIITNYNLLDKEMSVLVPVGVDYQSDLEQVERITIETAKKVMSEVRGGIPGFNPLVRYNAFGEYTIQFTVILRVREFTDQYLIKHEFIKRLHKRYQLEGIRIPYPARELTLSEGSRKSKRPEK
jgi:small-conductance mechanosensitive channel